MSEDLEILNEAPGRRIVRVTSRGKRIRRIKCRKGFKLAPSKKTCVPITSSEKVTKRRAIRKAIRTKRKNPAGRRKAIRRRLKAMRYRRSQGVKNPT